VRRLCAIVLILESVVIALAIVPAVKLEHASARDAVLAGGAAVVVAVATAAVARRHLPWTLTVGSLLQALIIAAGAIVPVMYILGGIFALLWITGIWLGHRVESAS
jgi:Protein of unknown function (DUF4233)